MAMDLTEARERMVVEQLERRGIKAARCSPRCAPFASFLPNSPTAYFSPARRSAAR